MNRVFLFILDSFGIGGALCCAAVLLLRKPLGVVV